VATNALTDAINQNTGGNSQGFPMGVPTSYSWYSGTDTAKGNTPPSNFSAVTGWGQIYPEAGAATDSNASASVQIENFQTYVLLTSGAWVLVQNQSTNSIGGAHYLADFSGNSSVPWKETTSSDGSVSVDAPQSGYNDHFWPGARGTYAPGTVEGVFVEASMKTSDPNANLVANLGADWWQSSNASFVSGFANNPGAGMSDWVKLTTSYQNLYFTSLSAAQLQADPPPGLTGSTSATPPVTTPPVTTPPVAKPPVTTPPVTTPPTIHPAVTQATASPGSGLEQVGDKIVLTLGFNEAVTVTGKPTLTLNDGDIATYVSGSGTNALIFQTTVASTDTSTSALAITGVNLPSGASIKDASGLSADLSGAAKMFTGLGIDPPPVSTPPVTTPPVTTPPVASDPTAPVLSVADHSPSVHGHGGTVNLGLSVKSSDPNDTVSVNIKGLARHEMISDNLDGHWFGGNDVTLTAAEVNSGLTLHAFHWWGWGQPIATLAVTATATDPTTGAVTTSAAQTITVTDPPARTATTREDHSFALLNQYLAGGGLHGQVDRGQVAVTASQATTWLNESLLTRPQH
jgi:hypothetical protein